MGGLAFIAEVQVPDVKIDVFVRVHDGEPVTGLSEEHFPLRQVGTERKLSHFAAYTQEAEIMTGLQKRANGGSQWMYWTRLRDGRPLPRPRKSVVSSASNAN